MKLKKNYRQKHCLWWWGNEKKKQENNYTNLPCFQPTGRCRMRNRKPWKWGKYWVKRGNALHYSRVYGGIQFDLSLLNKK